MADRLELIEKLVSGSPVARYVLAIATFSYLTCWFLRDVTETLYNMMLNPPAWLFRLWQRLDYIVMGPKGTYTPMLSTWHRPLLAYIVLKFFPDQFSPVGLDHPFADVGLGQPVNDFDSDETDEQDLENI